MPTTSMPSGEVHCRECTCLRGKKMTSPGRTGARECSFQITPSPDTIMVHPRPAYYPFPVARWVKTIGDAAAQFFESGAVPPLRKVLGIEAVQAEPEPREARRDRSE